jgi:hypothetical protein
LLQYSDDDDAHVIVFLSLLHYTMFTSLPPFKFFLCRLWIQQAITRILISTTTVPSETPINIKSPLDVFINGLPVVSVCWVVRIDNDCCGATDFIILIHFLLFLRVFEEICFFAPHKHTYASTSGVVLRFEEFSFNAAAATQ